MTYPSEKYESQLGLLFPIYIYKEKMFQTTNQLTIDNELAFPSSFCIFVGQELTTHWWSNCQKCTNVDLFIEAHIQFTISEIVHGEVLRILT